MDQAMRDLLLRLGNQATQRQTLSDKPRPLQPMAQNSVHNFGNRPRSKSF